MNENAYGPSERAEAAMGADPRLVDRVPHPTRVLVQEIARLHNVEPEHIVLGHGSTGIMRTAAAAFLGRRTKLVLASPTFDPIADYARSAGAEVVRVPITKHYVHNLDAMLAHFGAAGGLVYICNPNNPTGSLTLRTDLETFIQRLPSRVRVLIDEAYHHYVGRSSAYASFIDRPVDGRVIVTRTLSKVHGLARLRLGYAVAATETVRQLRASQLPVEITVPTLRSGVAALSDFEHVRLSVERNANDRQEFYNQANARMLRVADSHANFVFVTTGGPAEDAIAHLRRHDILVASVSSMPHHIRVSLGRGPDMLEFWRVWDRMPHDTMKMSH